MHIVTGGAGFIGSNIVRALNERGVCDIMLVDRVNPETSANLADLRFAQYLDRDSFRAAVARAALPERVEAIFHQGACTDTTESDEQFLMDNNFAFSRELLNYALARKIPLVYASSAAVYGSSAAFEEHPKNERPLNLYGLSKLAFDNHVRTILDNAESTLVGFRYFNVYGPRESHKGGMSSMAHQICRQIAEHGRVKLFEGTDGYASGEQRRDFIFVGDVVEANLKFAAGRPIKGIFNLGTGVSRSFNDVAHAVIKLLGKGRIEYVPFPSSLIGKYQSFTEAKLDALRHTGYDCAFTRLEDGITKSLGDWLHEGTRKVA